MNILNFMQHFIDEASCIVYLKLERERLDVVCEHCGGLKYCLNVNKLFFECQHCHNRQFLHFGTVMKHSKLSFRYWITTMFIQTNTKKSFSIKELRLHLGHKRYQFFCKMVCKIRNMMGKRDSRCRLITQVELTTDDSISYVKFNGHIHSHQLVTADKKTIKSFLSWVYITISSAKRLLPDVHHRFKFEYLQCYQHEFCYIFNRRHLGKAFQLARIGYYYLLRRL